jgi:DNA-directed RNA polymerase specialized sigma24 family protein
MTSIAEVRPVSSQTDLVRSAARGDALAFERLLASRADWAFRIARAMLGDESAARDATQDALVSAWHELPRLRDPEAFDAWLRRILVNACRAQLRVLRRRHPPQHCDRHLLLNDRFLQPRGGIHRAVRLLLQRGRVLRPLEVDQRLLRVSSSCRANVTCSRSTCCLRRPASAFMRVRNAFSSSG